MSERIIVPLEEKPLMDWFLAAAGSVLANIGVGHRGFDTASAIMVGMSLGFRKPELVQAILAALPDDCTDGVLEQADNIVTPFSFETAEAPHE